MKKIISIVDKTGFHSFVCPKCKHEVFLGYWKTEKSPKQSSCVNCNNDTMVQRFEPEPEPTKAAAKDEKGT